jgi:glucose-1-phosphate adenylyltransferase
VVIKQIKGAVGQRSTAAIPVGGNTGAIDFVLSNMVNSGITNVEY